MVGRQYTANASYRFGFNGKENDNEIKGEGNQQDYGMRIYDPRLGRFLTVDPIFKQYSELTPYQFASNTPIWAIDLDGLEMEPFQMSRVDQQNRAFEERLRRDDPENAEEIINSYRKMALLTSMSMLTCGSTSLFVALSDVVILYGAQNVVRGVINNDPGRFVEGRQDLMLGVGGELVGAIVSKFVTVSGRLLSTNGNVAYKAFSSSSIRTSQETVNGVEGFIDQFKVAGKYTGDPIDIVKMEDNMYTSVDHARLMAAENLGYKVEANVHHYNEPLTVDQARRFVPKGTPDDQLPKTWGEAVKARVGNQSSKYAESNPNGTFVRPKVRS